MIKPIEFAIALRYLRSRNKNRFISFISLTSIAGIGIAVAVLIVVLSVMNGFEYEVRARILQVVSHAAITDADGRLEEWQLVEDLVAAHPETVSVARFVSGQGMLVGDADIKGVEVRGIDPAAELRTSGIGDLLQQGQLESLEAGLFRIVIGGELADLLGVGVGDKLILVISQGVVTPAGLAPRMRRFEVSGIFTAGMYEYDRGLVYVNVADAARLFRLGDAVTGIRLAVADPLRAQVTVRAIAETLGRDVFITDWTRQHANFFRSIQLTKSIIFVILLLVVAVAAFNIISTLVMVVREKRAEIAILRTLGSSPAGVLGIFVIQGGLIGIIGTLFGVVLGVGVALNLDWIVAGIERWIGFRFLAPDIYFISDFPSRLRPDDVWQVAGIAVLLAFASTLYPAWRASVAAPAEALRHE
ncbi:MAG TPA: lipoprotein-releasing ABC transporter permease subunit [Gammaproteobacteria bacterium]|jgi:lipoprotein-releasing system permease protein|nr:lipoprotein-releasing system transmembrane subunit LolC [Chromatiales bacterium]MCP4925915.1 lipoprotein-releasing ABC transporter permease subunit [Gammaproteobacteria bacterium]MDP7154520.1 lipoprotein-releasing ABC transporter permease subunit [Gammaproteobacteria bacterium]MDP7296926.1 lipoprotein-releasing ABC transporter permease subunit [Gammaproteobacteria bacterium]MDP7659773.1 lipoprotein-releasing ABC transporter permease subunit [Gammaproteobacteria bacterium]